MGSNSRDSFVAIMPNQPAKVQHLIRQPLFMDGFLAKRGFGICSCGPSFVNLQSVISFLNCLSQIDGQVEGLEVSIL